MSQDSMTKTVQKTRNAIMDLVASAAPADLILDILAETLKEQSEAFSFLASEGRGGQARARHYEVLARDYGYLAKEVQKVVKKYGAPGLSRRGK